MRGIFADLVLRNGRIATLDDTNSVVPALAAREGRIIALGDEAAMDGLIGPDTVIADLAGKRAIPGIVDSHCHPDSHAARLARWHDVGPDNIPARQALLNLISEATRDAGGWFLGYRFDDTKSGGYPTLSELDAASAGRPLFILRTDRPLDAKTGVVNWLRRDWTTAILSCCVLIHGSLVLFRTWSLLRFSGFDSMTRNLAIGEWVILIGGIVVLIFVRDRNDTADVVSETE